MEAGSQTAGKVRYVVWQWRRGEIREHLWMAVSWKGDPRHKLLEGMVIAAYAVAAHDGYIYVRADLSVARLPCYQRDGKPRALGRIS